MVLMRWCAGVVTWMAILMWIASFILLGIFLGQRATAQKESEKLFLDRLIINFFKKVQVLLVRVQEAIRSPAPIKLCWQCRFCPIFLLPFQS